MGESAAPTGVEERSTPLCDPGAGFPGSAGFSGRSGSHIARGRVRRSHGREGVPMVTRETFPTPYKDWSISVVTEQLVEGSWAAVATVARFSGTAQEVTPVPIPDRR